MGRTEIRMVMNVDFKFYSRQNSSNKQTNKNQYVYVTIFSFHIFPEGTLLLSVVLGNLEQLMSCRHRGPTRCVYRPTGGAEE